MVFTKLPESIAKHIEISPEIDTVSVNGVTYDLRNVYSLSITKDPVETHSWVFSMLVKDDKYARDICVRINADSLLSEKEIDQFKWYESSITDISALQND